MNESTKRVLLPNADIQSDFSSLRKSERQKTMNNNLANDGSETSRRRVKLLNYDNFV